MFLHLRILCTQIASTTPTGSFHLWKPSTIILSMIRNPPRFDYLAIGHVAKDITDDGPILGGTVSYAGRTALSMGYRVGVITSCMDQFDLSLMEGIQLHNLPSEKTTTFENVYSNTGRTQIILSRASDLGSNTWTLPV